MEIEEKEETRVEKSEETVEKEADEDAPIEEVPSDDDSSSSSEEDIKCSSCPVVEKSSKSKCPFMGFFQKYSNVYTTFVIIFVLLLVASLFIGGFFSNVTIFYVLFVGALVASYLCGESCISVFLRTCLVFYLLQQGLPALAILSAFLFRF